MAIRVNAKGSRLKDDRNMIDSTHALDLKSWVESANKAEAPFPIQNLPLAVLRRKGHPEYHVATAIGDYALNLRALAESSLIDEDTLKESTLNAFMATGRRNQRDLRNQLVTILSNEAYQSGVTPHLIPLSEVEYALPCTVGDFTDFYTSIHHASKVGALFRPDNPLLPNYEWMPIAYHGRSSSVVISDTPIHRPTGQLKLADSDQPVVSPTRRLDLELELGLFIGAGNSLGQPIAIGDADEHLFGMCLLNDWSARDIQAWEYQPLGPFLAKSFATTISPWIVTMDALAPFRSPWQRKDSYARPLDYLESDENTSSGAINIDLEVAIATATMRKNGDAAQVVTRSNFLNSFWTPGQLVTHHSMNGCNLTAGDLLGSGTMSGDSRGTEGALIEMTNGGNDPLILESGEQRTFLQDGDEVILRAFCRQPGYASISFGEASGIVLAALDS